MILLDANYALRWFLGDVPEQSEQVDQLLASSEHESLRLELITLAEITYVLRGLGYDHEQIYTYLSQLYVYPSVIDPDDVVQAALTLFRETILDFEDCTLLAYHKLQGWDVATFDKALTKLIH